MKKTGQVTLPLHGGHAPRWLTERMKKLSREIIRLIDDEWGPDAFLQKISDPFWFQAFGCVLGFDWHSSGLTTVVTGVLKDVLNTGEHGLKAAGGKGRISKKTPSELVEIGDRFNLSTAKVEGLIYASRMCAKVDTAAIQAGYPIYHHAIFVSEGGGWCVIQQGLDINDRTARRYHWLSNHIRSFVVEPHEAIVGDSVRPLVLDMTAKASEENRKVCVDLVRDNPNNLISSISRVGVKDMQLDTWTTDLSIRPIYSEYSMPRNLNWRIFRELYDRQPQDYEELVAFRGVGPATIRALALVAELIYGKPASWRDPVKFSFAHGGKDGVPYPVNRSVMDENILIMREIVKSARLGSKDKVEAFKRLERLATNWGL